MSLPTVTPAESVTAIDFAMPTPGSEGYDEWRKSGKLPSIEEVKPAQDEKQVQQQEKEPTEGADSAPANAVTHAEPAPAPQQRKKDAAARLQQLLDERKREREEYRKEREEHIALRARYEELTKGTAKPSENPAPQPETGERPKPQLTDKNSDGTPKYKTIDEWQDARDAWMDDKRQKADQERILQQGMTEKLRTAFEKYPDFVEVTSNPTLRIPKGSAVDLFLHDSDNAGEIFYYLGKNPDILEGFYNYDSKTEKWSNKVHPMKQARELFEIENKLSSAAKPASQPPAKTITQAPRPPHQVSGKSPTSDPLAKAVEDGDQAEFTRLENERLLAAKKANRR